MSSFLLAYGLFLLEMLTFIAVFVGGALLLVASKKSKDKERNLNVKSFNEELQDQRDDIMSEILDKKEFKKYLKKNKDEKRPSKRLFVFDFDGDMDANDVESLRQHINIVLGIARPDDKILLRLESGGGYVHAYGLAAAQLQRIKDQHIPLCIAVDQIAASGGYMMACLADYLIAAPFAVIGSIGVVAGIPNINRLLKENNIDYEQHTAGQYKRTLSVLGENTEEGRAKFREELEATHQLFKQHVHRARPQIDIEKLATGETWYGSQALELGLIDELMTSDEYLLRHVNDHHILLINSDTPQSMLERLKEQFLYHKPRSMFNELKRL